MKFFRIFVPALFLFLSFDFSAHAQSTFDMQVTIGEKQQFSTSYIFSATFEPILIDKLRFFLVGNNRSVDRVWLFHNDEAVGNTVVNGGYASFENIGVVVDRNDQETLEVRVDYNALSDVSGDTIRFVLQSTNDWHNGGDVHFLGVTSGNVVAGGAVIFGADSTIVNHHVFQSTLGVYLDADTPKGSRGPAFGNENDLLYFVLSAQKNDMAPNPKEIVVQSVNVTFSGNAEVTDIALYGPEDGYREPIALGQTDHITSPTFDGTVTVVPFVLNSRQIVIPYNSYKKFIVRGKVNAPTDSNHVSRFVDVGIENFGVPNTAGDIAWYDNGLLVNNPDSVLVNWVYDPTGSNRIRTTLGFGATGLSGTITGNVFSSQAFFAEPIVPPVLTAETTSLMTEPSITSSVQEQTTVQQSARIRFEDSVSADPTHQFLDVSLDTLEGRAAAELFRRGVVTGYPDETFGGNKKVNRAEAAKILLETRLETVPHNINNGRFRDVINEAWYVRYVIEASARSIIQGYSDETFRPENTVNTAEFIKMLALTFELEENLEYTYRDVKDYDWFARYAGVTQKYNLFPGRRFFLLPARELTRNDVVIAIYQYLKNRNS